MSRKKVNRYIIPKEGTQEERLDLMLTQLDLQHIRSSYKNVHNRIKESQGTEFDFLESLCERESSQREENRLLNWTQKAKFPFKKTLEDFDFSFQPSINKRQINELRTCRYIRRGENILFLGPPGVGKTHLSIGFGLEAIYNGLECLFLQLDKLIDAVKKSDENTSPALLRKYMRPQLLILDDIDYYKTGGNASEFLFKLIKQRADEKLSMIFTSNKHFNDWGTLFETKVRAGAIIDRITSRAEIINITGGSYRLKGKKYKRISVRKSNEPVLTRS